MSRKSVNIRRAMACALVVLLCLMAVTACGDTKPESTSATTSKTSSATSGDVTTTTTKETVITIVPSGSTDSTPPETGPFTVLTEGVEADAIRYYQGSENYPFSVIEKDGKCGVIDYEGNLVVPMSYEAIALTTTYAYSEEIKLCIMDGYPTEVYWIEADGTLVQDEGEGWGFEYSEDVCWYDGKPIIVDMSDPYDADRGYNYDEYCYLMEGYVTFGLDFTAYGLPSVIPIREVSELGEEELTYASDNYALFDLKTAKLLTGFIYEDYAYGFVNGLMAVKRNGKWGYIRENGTVVTGFVYDPVVQEEYADGYTYSALYTPINGYIAVSQRGKWGIIDTDGKTVVTPQFEGITQVDEQGRFWFKQNGTWTAAKLNK